MKKYAFLNDIKKCTTSVEPWGMRMQWEHPILMGPGGFLFWTVKDSRVVEMKIRGGGKHHLEKMTRRDISTCTLYIQPKTI